MKVRRGVVAIVCAALMTAPVRARAQETVAHAEFEEASGAPLRPLPPRILLTPGEALATTRAPLAPNVLGARTTEVRLSEGAKTAIIVGAIVLGVLLIVGVVALGGPGKHLK